MMDDAELVKQLRNMNEYEPLGQDGWKAADRIEALIAERDTAVPADLAEAGKMADECFQAVSGEGPRAFDWTDKPHRLVYDMYGTIRSLIARAEKAESERDAARDAALEESAKVADECFKQNSLGRRDLYKWGIASGAQAIAAAIRALKGKSHE